MNNGFVRVAAAIPNLKAADCFYNAAQIANIIKSAEKQKTQIVCFPELSITAYTCGDLFLQNALIENAEKALEKLLADTKKTKIVAIVGVPIKFENRLYNTAVVIQSGKILAIVPKIYLPNYSEFYEKRWFASGENIVDCSITIAESVVDFSTEITFADEKLNATFAVEICEDLWVPVPPSSALALNGANIIFNLSASPEIIGKNDYLQSLICGQSARCMAAYVYASAGFGESSQDLVFAGNALIAENGSMIAESQRFSFEEQLVISDIDIEKLNANRLKQTSFADNAKNETDNFLNENFARIYVELPQYENKDLLRKIESMPFVPQNAAKRNERCEEIFSIQVGGLAKRVVHVGAKTLIIGVSGGLDSTLALLVCAKTLDKLKISRKQIIGITMPGFGTTGRTYNNAVGLMKSLGVTIRDINIAAACTQHFKDIGHDPKNHDVTYENTQARERTQILMDVANQENGLVVGTGDLSELALGWATYNGDHMSMYGVNTGVPKTLVRHLVAWAAEQFDKKTAKILLDVVATPVSPELLPTDKKGNMTQITEDFVGPYELHDFFLYYTLRFGFAPKKIFFLARHAFGKAYDGATIKKWMKTFYRRFFAQQFKRSCLPDGPKVGSVNLSPRGDWRMPSDASAAVWQKEVDEISE